VDAIQFNLGEPLQHEVLVLQGRIKTGESVVKTPTPFSEHRIGLALVLRDDSVGERVGDPSSAAR